MNTAQSVWQIVGGNKKSMRSTQRIFLVTTLMLLLGLLSLMLMVRSSHHHSKGSPRRTSLTPAEVQAIHRMVKAEEEHIGGNAAPESDTGLPRPEGDVPENEEVDDAYSPKHRHQITSPPQKRSIGRDSGPAVFFPRDVADNAEDPVENNHVREEQGHFHRMEDETEEGSAVRVQKRRGKAGTRDDTNSFFTTQDHSRSRDDDSPSEADVGSDGNGELCRVQVAIKCVEENPLNNGLHFNSPSSPPGRTSSKDAALRFDAIYKTKAWGHFYGTHTRSGDGSTLKGAHDTILHLSNFIEKNNVRTIADVSSGDIGWQFSIRGINAAKVYFGGDISNFVVQQNQRIFKAHLNKVFSHFDVVKCEPPTWFTGCDGTKKSFDMVIIRDVVQHLHVENAKEAFRRLILHPTAAPKYLAITTYPNYADSDDCSTPTLQCSRGSIRDGHWYKNRMHCSPWNFPRPLERHGSHVTFKHEDDVFEIYKVDKKLKNAVRHFDTCPDPTQAPVATHHFANSETSTGGWFWE